MQEDESTVAIGEKVGNEEAIYGFKYVESIDVNTPALIVFGGDGSSASEASNGYLSVLKKLLKRHNLDKSVRMYSVVYRSCNFSKEEKKECPGYIQDIFDKVFLPRIVDEYGQRLSSTEACNRVRKITVVAHCRGTEVVPKLEKIMQDKMQELGYSKEEREQIQHELLCVAFAPRAGFGNSKSTIISFGVIDDNERNHVLRWFNDERRYEHNNFYKLVKSYYSKACRSKFKSDGGFLFSYFPKGRGSLILALSLGKEIDSHDFLGYSPLTKGLNFNGRMWALMSENVIVNGIKNSISSKNLPSVEDLICGNNAFIKRFFKKIEQNGCKMWDKIKQDIIKNRKSRSIRD